MHALFEDVKADAASCKSLLVRGATTMKEKLDSYAASWREILESRQTSKRCTLPVTSCTCDGEDKVCYFDLTIDFLNELYTK